MKAHMDHLAVVAPSLEAGAAYVREALGVEPRGGGEHPQMGTHNRFVKLGEKLYLEVIAVNPAAPAPGRARWYEMDQPGGIRLAHWIVRTDDVRAAVAAATFAPGEVEPMARGTLNWLLTIPKDGSLPLGGVAPSIIEWPAGVHPASTQPDSGCTLVRLEGFHPQPGKVSAYLDSIGFEGPFTVARGERPCLVAQLRTPAGLRELR